MKLNRIYVILVFLIASVISNGRSQSLSPEDVYKKVLPSVMTLLVRTGDGSTSIGTGFLAIKDGVAVTAWHVVKGATSVHAKFSNGELFECSGLIDKDEKRDVALIRVKVFGRPLLEATKADPAVGAKAFLVGAPKGLEFTFTDGLISQLRDVEGMKQYQFSCDASPGNSGGPLLNSEGLVSGVVSWRLRDGTNLNFAVPIGYALGLDSTLPTQPWASVGPSTEPPQSREAATVSDDVMDRAFCEAIVSLVEFAVASDSIRVNVAQRSNGYKEGLPPYYFAVLERGKRTLAKLKPVSSGDSNRQEFHQFLVRALETWISDFPQLGEAIRLARVHNGWTAEANEALAKYVGGLSISQEMPSADVLKKVYASPILLKVVPIDAQVGFGIVKSQSGFTLGISSFPENPMGVMNVLKDSWALRLGFRTNDVILTVDGQSFESIEQIKMHLLQNKGKKLKAVVRREGNEKRIDLNIPADFPNGKP
ncbi:MAG: trypsin-like peptidase domain-containing protein [Chthonomonas sp.]|nr:trypsin-like peptidase domain-containing protein [Chthonomonas sp.]